MGSSARSASIEGRAGHGRWPSLRWRAHQLAKQRRGALAHHPAASAAARFRRAHGEDRWREAGVVLHVTVAPRSRSSRTTWSPRLTAACSAVAAGLVGRVDRAASIEQQANRVHRAGPRGRDADARAIAPGRPEPLTGGNHQDRRAIRQRRASGRHRPQAESHRPRHRWSGAARISGVAPGPKFRVAPGSSEILWGRLSAWHSDRRRA